MRRLPPLNAVKAFEAAARLLSFTKAGEELNVTHGAISRQVAALEEWLGVQLFERVKSQLILTREGQEFLGDAGAALDRLAAATESLTQHNHAVQLTVSAPPTFTLRWLIPRLSTFQHSHRDINVRLTTSLSPIDFSKDACDIAIRGSEQSLPGIDAHPFLSENILPVCHPDLLEKLPLAEPADLARHTLLTYSTEPYRWQEWFAAVGAADVKPLAALNFEQMYFALQAAMEGLGVALIPYFLVADTIAEGRLCAPLGALGVRTRRYYANLRPNTPCPAAQKAFCEWLEQEGRDTMRLCAQQISAFSETTAL